MGDILELPTTGIPSVGLRRTTKTPTPPPPGTRTPRTDVKQLDLIVNT